MAEERERDKPIDRPERNPDLKRQAKALERAVYGKPLVIHDEPSIGTQDTPARTDEVLPIHPGGMTKQGDDEPVGYQGPPHLPRLVDAWTRRTRNGRG